MMCEHFPVCDGRYKVQDIVCVCVGGGDFVDQVRELESKRDSEWGGGGPSSCNDRILGVWHVDDRMGICLVMVHAVP